MYYKVEWTEDEGGNFCRIYKARDFNTLWRLVSHMNYERKYSNRPVMKQLKITAKKKCGGEFFEITNNYDANMEIDAVRSEQ